MPFSEGFESKWYGNFALPGASIYTIDSFELLMTPIRVMFQRHVPLAYTFTSPFNHANVDVWDYLAIA